MDFLYVISVGIKGTDKRKISVEEFNAFSTKKSEEIRKVFDTLDKDKNEYIDMKEAQEALQQMNLDEKKFQILWNRIDKNKDGRVSFLPTTLPSSPFPSPSPALSPPSTFL
jgi:Ca2+-binding EF-hand superfamily protein